MESAASLVAQIWRVDDATPRRAGASIHIFPTVPPFESPRPASLGLLERAAGHGEKLVASRSL